MKVVYVIDSLASKGGAERILSDKMNYMTAHYGYNVYVVTCYQNPSKNPNAYFLSDKVEQINLNIPYYSQYSYGYPKRLWVKWRMYRELQQKLKATIKEINPDILIGLGYFMADVVTGIRCRAAKIVESHEARIFTLTDKGLSRSFLSRAYMKYYRKHYFRIVERKADVVVTLTTGDAKEWKNAKRVEVIPNFTVMPVEKYSSCKTKRVIAVGRLEWQKGFDRLIDAWAMVHQKHSDWQLYIYGSGTLEHDLKRQIRDCGLENNVVVRPFTSDINQKYAESSILVLSSRFEGLSLVLLEAIQIGLPCVVFDCPFGPRDVIVDNKNGFIVKDGDIKSFANRICQLMEDDDLRKRFSRSSIEQSKLFDVDIVMGQWKNLFEELTPK